ncbi:hypothetical protein [Mycolicibacterium wolinskyi]
MIKMLIYLFIGYVLYACSLDSLMHVFFWPLVGFFFGIWLLIKLIGALF